MAKEASSQLFQSAAGPEAAAAGRFFVQAASSGSPVTGCPVQNRDAQIAECPVVGSSGQADKVNPLNNMPDVSNQPSAAQAALLSTSRQSSSIPMASAPETTPQHQQLGAPVWVYPSEQMFFNAMKRKGWDPAAEDMASVVAIHNTVNEKAWREVLAFEELHCASCPNPRLKKFMGRPKDFSPKARFLNAMGYKMPFDRHDWVVDRCGEEVRYVIDFYNGVPAPGMPIAMHVDVRPALDSFQAALDRLRMQLRWMGSGRWAQE